MGMKPVEKVTVACVLRVGMEVQVGDVGGDVLDVGSIRRHQAANVAPCRDNNRPQGSLNALRVLCEKARLRRAGAEVPSALQVRVRVHSAKA